MRAGSRWKWHEDMRLDISAERFYCKYNKCVYGFLLLSFELIDLINMFHGNKRTITK